MKKLLVTIFGISISWLGSAQMSYKTKTSSEILHELKKLNSFGTVMYLAAHPDDENTRLISYLVHERNVRTIYYSLTRGDGGQNIIGSEQGKYLGLIRTLEMNEARILDGAEQIYSSAIDFGFSKNPEEVFTKWNKNQLIKEIKQAFQTYRPDVVILRFPTTGEGGHGQHTASAILAVEAYNQLQEEAKTNKNTFVPKRILFNAFNFGDRSTQREDQLKITINQFNPLLGKSYGQLAGESRSMHKSQGAGTPQSFGVYKEYFQHLGGGEAKKDILEGVDMNWSQMGLTNIASQLQQIINNFNPHQPYLSILALQEILKHLENAKTKNEWIENKIVQIKNAILSCAQISIEALSDKASYNTNEAVNVKINIAARAPKVQLNQISENSNILLQPANNLTYDSLYTYNITYNNSNKKATQPYWLENNQTNQGYEWHFASMMEQNTYTPFIQANEIKVNFSIQGTNIDAIVSILYKRLDPLRGDVMNPIRFEQDINIHLQKSLVTVDGNHAQIPIRITSSNSHNKIDIVYLNHKLATLQNTRKDLDTNFAIQVPSHLITSNSIDIEALSDGKRYNGATQVLKYDHIPETQYIIPSTQKIIKKEWNTNVKNIGYIQGADDLVDDVLKALDFNVVNLSKTDFQNINYINSFDAIVVGIRAYNVNEDISTIHPLLMKYIENGGSVVVQYHTDKNLISNNIGPYPLSLSRNRITQEDAPTTILNAKHRLLNYPNKIVAKDWDNWVQERGLYYPNTWDKNYQTLIQHQEFNEKPLESGILYTQYGKGHYIYTPLAFFRQLPDGNAGAIKLFINLLSVGK